MKKISKKKFKLKFNNYEGMFSERFKNVEKEFIVFLKEQNFLKKITPLFIEELPQTFNGEVCIDPDANTQECYVLFFYLTVQATEAMKMPTQEYLNRDIEINDEDEKLEFMIKIPKKSKFIKKSNNKKVVFSFNY